jgi:RsiW-degrading membrane proteinase PrsW (M82 family)
MAELFKEGMGALTVIFVLRGMAAPFSHPLFTSMTGIGLGWSRQSNNGFVKLVMPVLGFMLAILLHATWNGTATYGGAAGFFAGYFIIMGPGFHNHADGDFLFLAARGPHCPRVSLF